MAGSWGHEGAEVTRPAVIAHATARARTPGRDGALPRTGGRLVRCPPRRLEVHRAHLTR